jgi:hypothetical protein
VETIARTAEPAVRSHGLGGWYGLEAQRLQRRMIQLAACGRCGALTVTGSDCPDWGTAARPVADLLEQMAAQVLDEGGQVIAVRALPTVAARLRSPRGQGPGRRPEWPSAPGPFVPRH